jgi:hypothetical protein
MTQAVPWGLSFPDVTFHHLWPVTFLFWHCAMGLLWLFPAWCDISTGLVAIENGLFIDGTNQRGLTITTSN